MFPQHGLEASDSVRTRLADQIVEITHTVLDQLGWVFKLDHTTVFHNQNLVALDDGVESMRDHQDSTVGKVLFDRLLDQEICLQIDSASCLCRKGENVFVSVHVTGSKELNGIEIGIIEKRKTTEGTYHPRPESCFGRG